MVKNTIIRILWTFILLISIIAIGAFVWDVPRYMAYVIPPELAKLPMTLLLLVALIAGIAGIWSYSSAVSPNSNITSSDADISAIPTSGVSTQLSSELDN